MAAWLIAVVAVIYFITGGLLVWDSKAGLGIAFIAYGLANIGLFMEAIK